MADTIIDAIYKDNRALLEYLAQQGEVSFQSNVAANFRKTLLLSVASYFESTVKDSLLEFFGEESKELTVAFVRNKAIERQYHTFFSWEAKNANGFFGLFGSGFREFMSSEVAKNEELAKAIKAFLKLGNSRNELVHENFAIFPLETTPEQIHELYQQAITFIEALPVKLREYNSRQAIGVDVDQPDPEIGQMQAQPGVPVHPAERAALEPIAVAVKPAARESMSVRENDAIPDAKVTDSRQED